MVELLAFGVTSMSVGGAPAAMPRRAVLGGALAALLGLGAIAGLPALASGGPAWREVSSAQQLSAPGGATLPVYVTVAGRWDTSGKIERAALSTAAAPTGGGARQAHFAVTVAIPNGADGEFATEYTVSSGPDASGHIYAYAKGTSGRPATLQFDAGA